jgi:hypothetical protein
MGNVKILDSFDHKNSDGTARVLLLEETLSDGSKACMVRVIIREQYSKKHHDFACIDWIQANSIFSALRLTV